MANETYKLISSTTVGASPASSIEFTNIPQTYTDLKIVLSGRGNTAGNQDLVIRFNSNTANYAGKRVYGTGSGVASDSTSGTSAGSGTAILCGAITTPNDTANIFGNQEIYIPDYTSSTRNKVVNVNSVIENNATLSYQHFNYGNWSNTAAITSISLLTYQAGSAFVQYTTAYLYGISNVTAVGVAKATGGIINFDSTYVYHTFPWSGTFTPNQSFTAEYIVVAGGGGGGSSNGPGGGGGAGGFRYGSQSVTAQAYTVTVGGGGNGSSTYRSAAGSGSNSSFSTFSSTGGGAGGWGAGGPNTGGSGGGGAYVGGGGNVGANGNAGGYTPREGWGGGGGSGSPNAYGGGGGGGATSDAGGGTGSIGGAGGTGTNAYSTWATATGTGVNGYYAGGGGGGTNNGATGQGGLGGGGTEPSSRNGVANTGGGGAGTSGTAGAGGSGIVIVRYAR